jgi:hypothetical protein
MQQDAKIQNCKERGIVEILLPAAEPRTIFTISLQAGINNVSAIVCGFLAFTIILATLYGRGDPLR